MSIHIQQDPEGTWFANLHASRGGENDSIDLVLHNTWRNPNEFEDVWPGAPYVTIEVDDDRGAILQFDVDLLDMETAVIELRDKVRQCQEMHRTRGTYGLHATEPSK